MAWKQTLFEARHLYDNKLINGAKNRLYYALFQLMVENLIERKIPPDCFRSGQTYWQHDAVQQYLKCNCRELGLNEAHFAFFKKAKMDREQADYCEGFNFSNAEHQRCVEARKTIEAIGERLKESLDDFETGQAIPTDDI